MARALAPYRCFTCRLRRGLCVCPDLPRIETRTKILLLVHPLEDHKPTNTGRLAAACLASAEVEAFAGFLRPDTPLPATPGRRPVLLLPTDDARPIETFREGNEPLALMVPDGTWPQALRMKKRLLGLRDVPCARLPEETAAGLPAPLRRPSVEGRLATMAAVARALRVLEPDGVRIEAVLLDVLRRVVDRHRWTRGQILRHEIHGGVPAAALQHDPWS